MRRLILALFAAALVFGAASRALASDDKDADAIVDKAIQAVGGQEKLAPFKAAQWKSKGTITLQESDNEFTAKSAAEGLDRFRTEFDADINGNNLKGQTVIDGDKGWRKVGDGDAQELDSDALANEKRLLYLQLVAMNPMLLKDKTFKTESAGEEKVGDKPAVGLKVTGPDGKDFTLYFDKETGLLLREVAKVIGWDANEFTQDTTYSDYKDFDGIKKATNTNTKRDGEKFVSATLTDFKVLEKLDSDTFKKPD